MDETAKIYAKARETFLRENAPAILASLRQSGKLADSLEQTGLEAAAMFETISSQMQAHIAGQKMPYREKVKAMEAIPIQANEIVLHEIILVMPHAAVA
jgi:hypothetical protein